MREANESKLALTSKEAR